MYFTYDLCSLCLQKSIPSNTLFASTVCRYCHQISKSNASYFWVNNGNLDEGITFKYWCQWLTSAMHIMNIGIEFVGWCLFFLKIFIIKRKTYENQLQMTSLWTVSRAKLITDTMQHCSEFMNEWCVATEQTNKVIFGRKYSVLFMDWNMSCICSAAAEIWQTLHYT